MDVSCPIPERQVKQDCRVRWPRTSRRKTTTGQLCPTSNFNSSFSFLQFCLLLMEQKDFPQYVSCILDTRSFFLPLLGELELLEMFFLLAQIWSLLGLKQVRSNYRKCLSRASRRWGAGAMGDVCALAYGNWQG